MDSGIFFPHLHIYLHHVGKSFKIGNFSIAYYGVALALGMLAGLWIATWKAKKTGQNPEDYFDLAIIAIITSVIGARIYYVAFEWDNYKNDLLSIFNLREGGIAIYGAVIAAIITTYVFTRVKKLPFGRVCDTAGLGLLLGQIVGRWGNFFNREVYGDYTDSLFAMQIPLSTTRSCDLTEKIMEHTQVIDGVTYIQVHPTFLYESLWNLALLILLLIFFNKRKFEGEVFLWYMAGYGVGRFWIEWVRTDNLMIPGTGIPVSQLLAAILFVGAVAFIITGRILVKKGKWKEAEILTEAKEISADEKQN